MQKKIKLIFKKKWLKGMDMDNKITSHANFCNKIKKKFLEFKGYRIKVSKNSFILFENEQDYLNLFYLEKVVFDFINNL